MFKYSCPRCGYSAQKSDFRKHLERKKICELKNLDIDPREYKNVFLDNDIISLFEKIVNKPDYVSECSEENIKNFIYIIKEREFINSNQNIYKIGKTINPKQRLGSYPKGSQVYLIQPCRDCDVAEREILKIFKYKFKERKDLGNEYFEGDVMNMSMIIMKYFISAEWNL